MTVQGKPDRCPTCASESFREIPWCTCEAIPLPHTADFTPQCKPCPDPFHSSPVPAARKGSAEMDDGTHIQFAKNLVTAKPVPAAARQPTNRHGERVSRECGAGHHAECKESLETCHCTYRGLHKTMHAYATFPSPWEPADYKGYETRLSEEGYREVRKVGAPQAENVPSGKIAWPQHLDKVTLNPEIHAAAKEYMNSTWRSEGHWTEFIAYFAERMIASQTAALAAERDKLDDMLNGKQCWRCGYKVSGSDWRAIRLPATKVRCVGCHGEIGNWYPFRQRELEKLAADNGSACCELTEKVAELERSNSLLRERLNAIEKILRENERDGFGFCDNCLEFAPNHDENCWLAILLLSFKENQ